MDKYADIDISGSDTDKPLNLQRRVALAEPFLQDRPCSLLDCGCGAGGYVAAFDALPGIQAFGIEYEAGKVALALGRGLSPDRILRGDIQSMPYSDDSFDAVLLNEVLEHVPDHRLGLSEVCRVLRPGGTLLVFSPNRCYPFETHGVVSRRSGKRLPHYLPCVPWIPMKLGCRLFTYPARNFWPWELRRLLTGFGFTVLDLDYVWQTFENLSGAQPAWIKRCRGVLWATSRLLEKTPLLRMMGVSQFLALRKPGGREASTSNGEC
jgi:SAM-dependent methyltransferase